MKFKAFGLQSVLPGFCRKCGGKMVFGEHKVVEYDEQTGEPIYSVQLHCEKAEKEDLERGGAGGNYEPKHAVIYRQLKEDKDE